MKRYKIDLPVILMFIAVAFDIITTFLFITLGKGVEKNSILASLINISPFFIIIYLIFPKLFVPLLNDILRKSFAWYMAVKSFLLGLNNLFLILIANAFIIDNIGWIPFQILTAVFGLFIFSYLIYKNKLNRKERLILITQAFLFVVFLAIIDGLFYLITVFILEPV